MTSQSPRVLQHNRCTQDPGIQPTGGPTLVGLGWLMLFVGYAPRALTCPALLSTLFYTSADRPLKSVSPNLIALWFLVRFLWEACSGDWQVERGRGLVFLLCFLYPLAPQSWQKLHLPSLWLLSMAQVLHGAPVTPYLLLVPSDLGVVRTSSILTLWWVLSTCSHLSVVSTQNLFCSTIWLKSWQTLIWSMLKQRCISHLHCMSIVG